MVSACFSCQLPFLIPASCAFLEDDLIHHPNQSWKNHYLMNTLKWCWSTCMIRYGHFNNMYNIKTYQNTWSIIKWFIHDLFNTVSKPHMYKKMKNISPMTSLIWWNTGLHIELKLSKMKLVLFHHNSSIFLINYHCSRVATCDSMSARAIRPAICKWAVTKSMERHHSKP